MFRYKYPSMVNDEFTSTIALALRKAMEEYEGRTDEQGRILYRLYQGSAAVWYSLYIHGIELFGKTYEQFLEECKEKKNIVFLSDKELKDYNRAMKVIEFMRE